jgi:ribonuclease BN (tRNA processing enzyme)
MKLWVLGSGTLIPHPSRGSPAHLLETAGSSFLLDCGSGALRALARLDLGWEKISHLLITHFHTDHVGDLAALLFAFRHGLPKPRRKPLHLLGPQGLEDHLVALSKAHGEHILQPGLPMETTELFPGSAWTDPATGLRIETCKTPHTHNSMAYRLESDEKVLGYVGDTGPSAELGSFLKGCQVVVTECSHPRGRGMDTHLTPQTLAEMVRISSPDLLVPVHVYPPLDPEQVPDLLAEEGYLGKVVAGKDGMCVEWLEDQLLVRLPDTGV